MGNCVFRGFGGFEELIKVVTQNGGIMELYAPITAECITNEFPGHGIFRNHNLFSPPLLHNEVLQVGELYYLLPLNSSTTTTNITQKHGRDKSSAAAAAASSVPAPYRVSFDNQCILRRSEAEVFPRYNSTGVWKVKLVISPEQLSEILSEEAHTEALIESVRTVAKCSNGVANSDQWSTVSSSWKSTTASDKFGTDDNS